MARRLSGGCARAPRLFLDARLMPPPCAAGLVQRDPPPAALPPRRGVAPGPGAALTADWRTPASQPPLGAKPKLAPLAPVHRGAAGGGPPPMPGGLSNG